jgi:hypothetical protein
LDSTGSLSWALVHVAPLFVVTSTPVIARRDQSTAG